jgi:hypothetical protein
MSKVWVLFVGSYEDRFTIAVFSSEEDAEKARVIFGKEAEVTCFCLDPERVTVGRKTYVKGGI